MRISTKMMFDSGTQNLLSLQSDLYKLQNQMSTGRKILTPADDPVAAAQALVVTQRQSINKQFIDNQGAAESLLAEQESRLSSISDLLQSVKERLVQAGNGSYSDGDRKILAAEIRERYDELLGLANSADSMGNYVFSGLRGDTRPFDSAGTPGSRTVSYNGDEGQRQLQVSTGRIMGVSESGQDVFMRIPQGNGAFLFTTDPANTLKTDLATGDLVPKVAPNSGSAVISGSSIIDGYDGKTYSLEFDNPPTTYKISTPTPTSTNPAAATVLATGQLYTSGSAIVLGTAPTRISITISGTPAAGDVFQVQPSTSQDVFKTLDKMIGALEKGTAGNSSAQANMRNSLSEIDSALNNALDRITTQQTSIGSRRVELEALSNFANDMSLQYQNDLSKLQDLDYTEAISSMSNRKMALEAAQASFVKVSQMSLFSYL